jgi:hypothetical protein
MTEDQKINSAKENVKKALSLAVENPSDFRMKAAANALVMANTLVKNDDLTKLRSEATKGQTTKFQDDFNKKLTQEAKNIREWHSTKVAPSKPKISQRAKAAAGKIGEVMQAALKAPGRAVAAVANKVQGKKEGPSR